MRIKLNKIKLENFKGVKSFEFSPNGRNALIRAENGVGKTTVYDGFMWGLFGKDSDGKTDFSVRPLDAENNPIKGLVVAVEVVLEINGDIHTLRKEQHDHISKGGKVSYPKEYIIDGEPGILEKNFKDFIANIIPEDKFKMFTDLSYLCDKLHWTTRRELLLDVAGNLPNPAGFDGLLEKLNGKKVIKAYEKILKERIKGYEKERDEINPRIDELQRGLDDFAQSHGGESESFFVEMRDECQGKVGALAAKCTELLAGEKQRQEKAEKINDLIGTRLHRESVVKQKAGAVDDLLDERARLEKEQADKTQGLVDLQNLSTQAMSAVESAQSQIKASQLTLKQVRDERSKADDPNCSLCGQVWPVDKPKPGLADIETRGNAVKSIIDRTIALKSELRDALSILLAQEKDKAKELKTAEVAKNKRIAEINETIENRPEPDPKQDLEWQKITIDLENLQAELGKPASEQLGQIEAKKEAAESLLNDLNKSLNQFDNNKKVGERIAELEARNKELTQKIADCDKELDEIGRFKIAESKMVEASVNGLFQHVEWKLFEYFLNGEIKEICVCILDGVPYPDMSFGQKIYATIDVINTLSDHYGVEVPLFLDHAESMTLPIEAESQVIKLYAQEGVKELVVEVEQVKGEKNAVKIW